MQWYIFDPTSTSPYRLIHPSSLSLVIDCLWDRLIRVLHHGSPNYAQELQYLLLGSYRYDRWHAVSDIVLRSFFRDSEPVDELQALGSIFRQ